MSIRRIRKELNTLREEVSTQAASRHTGARERFEELMGRLRAAREDPNWRPATPAELAEMMTRMKASLPAMSGARLALAKAMIAVVERKE